jgi:hypothetical protein
MSAFCDNARHRVSRGNNLLRPALPQRENQQEIGAMRKLLLGLMSLGAVTIAAPAQSQVYVGAGPVGVEVGAGPRHYRDDDWRWRHRRDFGARAYDSYGACRVVRERIETPSGRVIIKTRRSC